MAPALWDLKWILLNPELWGRRYLKPQFLKSMQENSVLLVWCGDTSISLAEFHWAVAPRTWWFVAADKAFLASALLTFPSKTAFFYAKIVRAVCAIFGIFYWWKGIYWNQVSLYFPLAWGVTLLFCALYGFYAGDLFFSTSWCAVWSAGLWRGSIVCCVV